MERRLAAIFAADVVGYSRLMGEDEAGTLARLEGLKAEILDPLVGQHHGRVVKLMGDGFLIEFASVVDALECAVAWQRAVETRAQQVPEDTRPSPQSLLPPCPFRRKGRSPCSRASAILLDRAGAK